MKPGKTGWERKKKELQMLKNRAGEGQRFRTVELQRQCTLISSCLNVMCQLPVLLLGFIFTGIYSTSFTSQT